MRKIGQWWTTEAVGKIYAALKEIGFETIADYFSAHPCDSYGVLADRIAVDLAPIQLIKMRYQEAKSTKTVRKTAIDALVRNIIEKLSQGWGKGENPNWQRVLALSSWASELSNTGELPQYDELAMQIAEHIRDNPPPEGWLPQSIDDQYLNAVFDKLWPEK
ncbi:MAG: hypothetical protein ACKVT0_07375 [Planctomycetaceae bacterium]